MTRILIGTRGSQLARAQSEMMAAELRRHGHQADLEIFVTRGDKEQHATVPELGGKGLFTAELEQALLDGRIHVAVHSLKDLPTEDADGLTVGAVPPREDHRDALVSKGNLRFVDLPQGAKVGTASLRRRALLRNARPDLDIQPLRGNVDTRIRKALEGELDAVVLAAAGLNRIGRPDVIADHLDFLPAPAQGALGIQCRAGDEEILAALAALHDESTARRVVAERVLLNVLEGGCSVPVGALGTIDPEGRVHLRGLVAAIDGSRVLEAEASGDDPAAVGREVAERLREQGAQEILDAAT